MSSGALGLKDIPLLSLSCCSTTTDPPTKTKELESGPCLIETVCPTDVGEQTEWIPCEAPLMKRNFKR